MIHLYYVGLFVWSGSVKIFQRVPPCLITMQPLSSRLLRVCTCASALPTPFFLFWTSIYALADIHFTFQFRFLSNLSLSLSGGQSIDSLQSTCNGHTHALTHTHTYHSFAQVENLADYQKPLPLPSNLIQPFYVLDFASCPKARLFFNHLFISDVNNSGGKRSKVKMNQRRKNESNLLLLFLACF